MEGNGLVGRRRTGSWSAFDPSCRKPARHPEGRPDGRSGGTERQRGTDPRGLGRRTTTGHPPLESGREATDRKARLGSGHLGSPATAGRDPGRSRETPKKGSAPSTTVTKVQNEIETKPGAKIDDSLLILPQVHLRKPCYDFYYLRATEFGRLPGAWPDP